MLYESFLCEILPGTSFTTPEGISLSWDILLSKFRLTKFLRYWSTIFLLPNLFFLNIIELNSLPHVSIHVVTVAFHVIM